MARGIGHTSKNKERLWKALRAEYGENFDPIMQMAKNSHRLQVALDAMYDEKVDSIEKDKDFINKVKLAEIVNNAWDKVTAYVQPKLKAVEISMGEDEDGKSQVWTINIVKGD